MLFENIVNMSVCRKLGNALSVFSLITIFLISPNVFADGPSFYQSKNILMKFYIQKGHTQTFYCGCEFDKEKSIKASECGYKVRKSNKRASRIEWEHIVPASRLGKGLQCWKQGDASCVKEDGETYKGRKCCRKVSERFRKMEADMHNLVPSVGEINGDRSNFQMGLIFGEKRSYGTCDFEVDTKYRVLEPTPSVRGDVARAYLYAVEQYGISLSTREQKLFDKWSLEDPATAWELKRTEFISNIQ